MLYFIIDGNVHMYHTIENIHDDMTTEELIETHVLDDIKLAFKETQCIEDSMDWNFYGNSDFRDILRCYIDIQDKKAVKEFKQKFEDKWINYIRNRYIDDYEGNVFQSPSLYKVQGKSLKFRVTLHLTAEHMIEEFFNNSDIDFALKADIDFALRG